MSKINHVKYCQCPLTDSTRLRNHLSKTHNIHVPSIPMREKALRHPVSYLWQQAYVMINIKTSLKNMVDLHALPTFPEINSLHHIQELRLKQSNKRVSYQSKEDRNTKRDTCIYCNRYGKSIDFLQHTNIIPSSFSSENFRIGRESSF
jgi:hypothetical protein